MNDPKTRQAPAGPTTEQTNQDPSQVDAMPARDTDDEPESNESVEG